MNSDITVHMMLKNEGSWCWFSLLSVIDYVDSVIIYDTGSSDSTIKCIEWFIKSEKYGKKIRYEEKGSIAASEIYKIRQEMIDKTNTKWFLILDGDEVWFRESIIELCKLVSMGKYKMIATRFINCVGNVYCRQNDNRENYNICEDVGAITIRAYSKEIPNIHCAGVYGVEGFFDENLVPVQTRMHEISIQKGFFLHLSNTIRTTRFWGDVVIPYRWRKFIAEYDYKVTNDPGNLPEVFFYKERPSFVPNPLAESSTYFIISFVLKPIVRVIKKIKNLFYEK